MENTREVVSTLGKPERVLLVAISRCADGASTYDLHIDTGIPVPVVNGHIGILKCKGLVMSRYDAVSCTILQKLTVAGRDAVRLILSGNAPALKKRRSRKSYEMD
jgi:hypothetical protein